MVYWNYDLHDLIKNTLPKANVQNIRDAKNKQKKELSENHLVGEGKIVINDNHLLDDWDDVTSNRKIRNTIAKYVGKNCHHLNLPKDKSLVVNSEAVVNGESVVPQRYTYGDKNTLQRTNAYDLENMYAEGEGKQN